MFSLISRRTNRGFFINQATENLIRSVTPLRMLRVNLVDPNTAEIAGNEPDSEDRVGLYRRRGRNSRAIDSVRYDLLVQSSSAF